MKVDSANFTKWLERAENDLRAAHAILEYYEDPPTDTACYHAHQVAEKSLKAFLLKREGKLVRTHDLVELLNLCAAKEKGFARFKDDIQALNKYYIETRYPPDQPIKYSKNEAEEAVSIAKKILEFVKEY